MGYGIPKPQLPTPPTSTGPWQAPSTPSSMIRKLEASNVSGRFGHQQRKSYMRPTPPPADPPTQPPPRNAPNKPSSINCTARTAAAATATSAAGNRALESGNRARNAEYGRTKEVLS